MVTNKGNVVSSDRAVSSLCNPVGLPRDGVIEKGDFACWPKNSGWVYLMRPKNPNQASMTSYDGEPKFVKKMSAVKCFGERSLGGYLQILAERYGMTVRRINIKNPIEEIWQFC